MTETEPMADRGELFGRESELSALLTGLEQAQAGYGRLVLIGGEPGIGKSSLADEFARRARAHGAAVLWGRCWDGAGAPAYWPWIQALRAYLRNADPAVAREQLGSGAVDVAQMLPEIRRLVPDLSPAPADSDSARFQLFDSTAAFLRNMAQEQPTVLILDDLHAGDAPSIVLLRFLASQLSDMSLVVVGTYRDIALTPGHPLSSALAEVAREPITRLMTLKGLPEDDITRFLESATGVQPAARLAREMWRATGGNPLFVGEAVRLLLSEQRLDELAAGGTLRLAVPAGVRDVIARRVGQLSVETVRALTIGAALGPEFAGETLRRAGGYEASEVLSIFDTAVRADLLAPVSGSLGRYRFSHDLVREAVYQEQSPAERVALHERIALILEEMHGSSLDANLAELAHHFFEATRGGGPALGENAMAEKAQDYARRAGELAASSLAYEEAARHFRMALAVLELTGSDDDEQRTELLLSIGDAETRAGDLESARASLLQAAAIARRTGVAVQLAHAALAIGGRLPWARPGRETSLIPLLQEALVLLGGSDEALRVRLMARLATAWRSTPEQRQQSDTLSRQALESARRLGDAATLSYALAARFWATWWPENPDHRLSLAAEMIDVARESGDAERLIDARLMLWLSYTELGLMAEAALEIDEIQRLADELRQPAHLWLGIAPRALIAPLEGNFELAEELIERELEPRHATTPARDNVSAATCRVMLIARERGKPASALDAVRSAVVEFPWYPLHRAGLALLLIDLDQRAEARELIADLAQDDFAALYPDNEWLLGMSLASEACALLDDQPAAATLYRQLAPFAGRHAIGHNEGSVGVVDRYLGLLAASLGRLDDAERHLGEAIELNEKMGARPWAAHSRADLAQVLRRRDAAGDEQRALELEAAAVSTADQLGMIALAERLAGAKADIPESPPSSGPPAAATFRREGEYWTITFGPDTFRVRDAKGLHYLARLLAEPGRELLALDLAGGKGPGGDRATAEPELGSSSMGGAGPLLDEQAKQEYRRRLHELQQELDEAEGWNDTERAEQARIEMDFLTREISGAVGLGGRDRLQGSASERARLSVTRAIRLAMARIAEHSAALGEHLETTIRTGTYCAYRPDPRAALEWQT